MRVKWDLRWHEICMRCSTWQLHALVCVQLMVMLGGWGLHEAVAGRLICSSEQEMARCQYHSCTVPCTLKSGCRPDFKRNFGGCAKLSATLQLYHVRVCFYASMSHVTCNFHVKSHQMKGHQYREAKPPM